MLTRLQVRDFAIVDEIAVEFGPGMTVLTGETGAGKSILVDAVGLVLGDRGGSQLVRAGAQRAEFSADFDISALPQVRTWLRDQALDQGEDCLLRRVISADGRTRAFINGNAVTIQQLKLLGELLLDIHGQHFHQSLGRSSVQRDLLDYFAKLLDDRSDTAIAFTKWQSIVERLQRLEQDDLDRSSRLDLMTFQLQELNALDPQPDEFTELNAERKRLKNITALAEGVGAALSQLSSDEVANASGLLAGAARSVESLVAIDSEAAPILELIETAKINVSEASDALGRYAESVETDPGRRDWVEERLDALQAVARKHRLTPADLGDLRERLARELDELEHAEERGKELQAEAAAAEAEYRTLALALSSRRKKAGKAFAGAITETMASLGMPGGKFEVKITPRSEDKPRSWGIDDIEFLISANPGQPPMPLSRVASGGELARMSLAIQVIASGGSAIPTMVFDEVDSGVGGGIAEMVGRRLRDLSQERQVLCVTHLPQVASQARYHFRISKVSDGSATRTRADALGDEERIQEIARMLGGVEITRKTLDHAAEMLAGGARKRA